MVGQPGRNTHDRHAQRSTAIGGFVSAHHSRRAVRGGYVAVRSLILAVSTLAIVGVFFAVYQFASGVGRSEESGANKKSPIALTPASDLGHGVSVGGAPIGRGARTAIRLYEPGSNRPRMEMEVTDWAPTGRKGVGGGDEFRLLEPEIRMTAPKGQQIRVTADEGVFWMVKRNSNALEPKNGRLIGNVQIVIDRIGTEEREKLTEEERENPTEERLVKIGFEEVLFDLEQSSLSTDAPFWLRMAEARLSGNGLFVRYNAVNARIEHFEIPGGGQAIIDAPSQMFGVSLPGGSEVAGAGDAEAAEAPEAMEAAEVSNVVNASESTVSESTGIEESAESFEEEGVSSGVEVASAKTGSTKPAPAKPEQSGTGEDAFPIFSADEEGKRPVETYRGRMDGDVVLEQLEGSESVAKLVADKLTFLFDFGPDEREKAHLGESRLSTKSESTTGSGEGENPEKGGNAEERENVQVDGAAEPILASLRWTGSFVVKPSDKDRLVEPARSGDPPPALRMQMVASGERVMFTDRESKLDCTRLEMHRETGRIWIVGSPFVLHSEHCAEMVGTEAFVDRSEGIAQITGPARMAGYRSVDGGGDSTDGQGEFEIRFNELAEIKIEKYKKQLKNRVTGDITEAKRAYFSEVRLTGDVRLRPGSDLISGDLVFVTFDAPEQPGAVGQQMRTLDAQGNVVMIRGEDALTCSTLSMAFGTPPGSEGPIPRHAEAKGDVRLTQGTLMIESRDFVTINMVPLIKEKRPWDLAAARLIAVQRGVDPAEIDWEEKRREYEQKIEYTTGLQSIDARGDVTAYDPTAGLDLSAQELHCSFADDRQLKKARLVGREGEYAFVQMSSFSVGAHRIDLSMEEERAEVFGPGEVAFTTLRGLDGGQSDTPQNVEISWSKEMTFRGKDNTGRFLGDVHAVTRRDVVDTSWAARLGFRPKANQRESSTFHAGELVIDFVEKKPVEKKETDSFAEGLWLFSPLADFFIDQHASSQGPQINREPVYVVASHDVVASFTNTDPVSGYVRNRVRLSGEKLTVDLRTELLNVPVAGNLLIEDYQLPDGKTPAATSKKSRAAKTSPNQALFASGDGMPSQSFIKWTDSLTFHAVNKRADFIGNVLLDHRRGAKMAMMEELLASRELGDLKMLSNKGRHTRLTCKQFSVEFGKDEQQTPSGVGALSVRDIKQFQAIGEVFLEDDAFNIVAHRLDKHDHSNLLRIFGREGENAEIYGNGRNGFHFKGPECNYNLLTEQVDAPRAQLGGRR